MKKISHNKSSKPTRGQAACGLTHCYVDARIGARFGKNNESKKSIIKYFSYCSLNSYLYSSFIPYQ